MVRKYTGLAGYHGFHSHAKRAGRSVRSKKVIKSKGVKIPKSLNTNLNTPVLPIKKRATLSYYDNNNFTTGAAASSGYVFTANGLYDPNITGVGHQPMGFDQMMLFYEHYTVTSCRLTVNFYNADATNTAMVGILVAPDATLETNYSKLNENGLLKKIHLSPTGSNPNNFKTISMQVNISKINGKKDVKSEDDFRGDVASNPLEQTYFHVFGYNFINVNTVSIYFETLLEYTAEFTEPKKMIQS